MHQVLSRTTAHLVANQAHNLSHPRRTYGAAISGSLSVKVRRPHFRCLSRGLNDFVATTVAGFCAAEIDQDRWHCRPVLRYEDSSSLIFSRRNDAISLRRSPSAPKATIGLTGSRRLPLRQVAGGANDVGR
jgi:hypothetical protein